MTRPTLQTRLLHWLRRFWITLGPWRRTKLAAHFVGYSAARFWNDRCFSGAAALSYSMLIALIPTLAIGFAVLQAFPDYERIINELKEFVTREFVPKNIDLKTWIDDFLKNTRGLTAIGIFGLAVTTIILLDTIEGKFNQIFRQKKIRPFPQRLVMFWAIVTLTPMLIGGSIALSEFFVAKANIDLKGDKDVRQVFVFWQDILPYLLLVLAFTLAYIIIPYRRVPVINAVFGAIVAAALFTLLRWGFQVYFDAFPAYTTIYGAFSLVPLFLVWMYLVWCATLLGAQMVASLPEWLARRRMFGGSKPTRRLLTALAVLHQLYLGMKTGRPVRQSDLSRQIAIDPTEFRPLLDELSSANFISPGDEQTWLLAQDPRRITLFDLYVALDLHLAPDFDDQSSGFEWIDNFRGILEREENAAQDTLGLSLDDLFTLGEGPSVAPRRLPKGPRPAAAE